LNTLLVDYSKFGFVSIQFKNDIFLKYCFVEDDNNIDKKIFNYLDSLCVDDDDDCGGYSSYFVRFPFIYFFIFLYVALNTTLLDNAYFNSNFQGFKENPYFEETEYNRIY
jgi:hypothetical protein